MDRLTDKLSTILMRKRRFVPVAVMLLIGCSQSPSTRPAETAGELHGLRDALSVDGSGSGPSNIGTPL